MSAPEQCTECSECGGPLGAYMMACHCCHAPISKHKRKKRLGRVLRALCGLFAHTHSVVPDSMDVALFALGAGATTAAVLGGLGLSLPLWLGAGLVVWVLPAVVVPQVLLDQHVVGMAGLHARGPVS